MQARYYDPVIGRFYSNDPVDYTAQNPVMSFNRYACANNNPYKYVDPTGMASEKKEDATNKKVKKVKKVVKEIKNKIKEKVTEKTKETLIIKLRDIGLKEDQICMMFECAPTKNKYRNARVCGLEKCLDIALGKKKYQ